MSRLDREAHLIDLSQRPHRRRRAMRVLLVDPHDRILLFEDRDRGVDPIPTFWITPGGGVDPGETDAEAAVREVHEETGLALTADDLIGPLATRTAHHSYSDVIITQDEVFWVVRCPTFEVSTAGHTADELATMTRHHWWSRSELEATTETVWPADVLEIVDLVGPDGRAPERPIDLGTADESTVASGHTG